MGAGDIKESLSPLLPFNLSNEFIPGRTGPGKHARLRYCRNNKCLFMEIQRGYEENKTWKYSEPEQSGDKELELVPKPDLTCRLVREREIFFPSRPEDLKKFHLGTGGAESEGLELIIEGLQSIW